MESKGGIKLSPKYKAFLRCAAPVEFLEGTTMAGKTTVGAFKFILKVAASPKKLHIIAAKDTGSAEKNIINKDLGILDIFGELARYHGNGTKDDKIPHIVLHTSGGDKTIYIMGYGDRQKWKKALGGQYGCLYIDEINTADIEFVREAAMRCDYFMATLNPDDPGLLIYSEYINCSRPLPEWESDTPAGILSQLTCEHKRGWVHWFFSFRHNPGISREELDRVLTNTPKGTKIYKNKILGLRGRATGLVFPNFDRARHVITAAQAREYLTDDRRKERFLFFTSGLDTAYSSKSPDTIAMSFAGITSAGRYIKLCERVYNNRDLSTPLAPSDTAPKYVEFLEQCRAEWGFSRNAFIDSADQATMTELKKFKRQTGCIYTFNNAWKRLPIIDRIKLVLGWLEGGYWQICSSCVNTIAEMESYSWRDDPDNTPEDGNDHCINADQYGFIPYKEKIGERKNGADK